MKLAEMKPGARQFLTYGAVGALNTAITFAVVVALTWLGVDPLLANPIGFAAGLINSFTLNYKVTFGADRAWRSVLPFLSSFAICYALNFLVLMALTTWTSWGPIVAQILAMLSYNLAFFVLMKGWVFRRHVE
jgi:putative flippase GtrA